MAEKLIKSVLWLGGFSLVGYGLMIFSTPNAESLRKELPGIEKSRPEVRKKKQQFVDVLQTATYSDQPLYRLDKEGIDKEIKKN